MPYMKLECELCRNPSNMGKIILVHQALKLHTHTDTHKSLSPSSRSLWKTKTYLEINGNLVLLTNWLLYQQMPGSETAH